MQLSKRLLGYFFIATFESWGIAVILPGMMSKYSRGDETAWIGNPRTVPLLFANDVIQLAPSAHDLQQAFGQLAAECEAAKMKLSISKSETEIWPVAPSGSEARCCPQPREFYVSWGLVRWTSRKSAAEAELKGKALDLHVNSWSNPHLWEVWDTVLCLLPLLFNPR